MASWEIGILVGGLVGWIGIVHYRVHRLHSTLTEVQGHVEECLETLACLTQTPDDPRA